ETGEYRSGGRMRPDRSDRVRHSANCQERWRSGSRSVSSIYVVTWDAPRSESATPPRCPGGPGGGCQIASELMLGQESSCPSVGAEAPRHPARRAVTTLGGAGTP